MKKLKSKWIFFMALFIFSVIGVVALFFLKRKLPTDTKDFTSDIIAVLALTVAIGFPLYEKFFPKKLLRNYDISPQSLTSYIGDDITLKVRLINSGEVNINIQFEWIEFKGIRFILGETKDSRRQTIDSSIVLEPRTQKEVYLIFKGEESSINKAYVEAFNKKEPRLIEDLRHISARLTWSDVTSRMQEKNIPLGAWLIDYLHKDLGR